MASIVRSGGLLTGIGAPAGVSAPATAQQGLLAQPQVSTGGDSSQSFPTGTTAVPSGYNLSGMSSGIQGLQDGSYVNNQSYDGNGGGGGGSALDGMGSLVNTGNAAQPYAAYTGTVNGNQNFEIGNGKAGGTNQDIMYNPSTGSSGISTPIANGDDDWSQFAKVLAFAAPIAPMLAGWGAAGGAGAAGLDTTASDASLDALGNSGVDTVYGTSAPGGLADASGAGIPSGLGGGAAAGLDTSASDASLNQIGTSGLDTVQGTSAPGGLADPSGAGIPSGLGGGSGLSASQITQLLKSGAGLLTSGGASAAPSGSSSGGGGGLGGLGGLGGGAQNTGAHSIIASPWASTGILTAPSPQNNFGQRLAFGGL